MERIVIITGAALLLLNFVVVPALGLLLASRRDALAEAGGRRRPAVDGYASILLSRLMVQTCRVLGLERACLLVAERHDPTLLTVVVAHGLHEDMIGRRVPLDGPLRAALTRGGPQRVDARAFLPSPGAEWTVAAGVAARTHDLLLCAAPDHGLSEFGEREKALLGTLAGLCASALDDLAIKEHLDSELRAVADALAAACVPGSRFARRHHLDAASLAMALGRRLQLEPGALIELELAAHVSDAGGAETPALPADRLERIPGFEVVALIVRCARERWDGRGPLALPGNQIPLASRILAACAAVRTFMADRPGRRREAFEMAVRSIQGASGTVFDPTVVTALSHELIGDLPALAGEALPAADWARQDSQFAALP